MDKVLKLGKKTIKVGCICEIFFCDFSGLAIIWFGLEGFTFTSQSLSLKGKFKAVRAGKKLCLNTLKIHLKTLIKILPRFKGMLRI